MSKRSEIQKSCALKLQKVLKMKVYPSMFYDLSLADSLRNHIFDSLEQKNAALRTFCKAVFADKAVHDAIHIKIEGPSTFKSISIEQSIAKGLKYEICKEFDTADSAAVPRWYLTAKVKSHQ